MNETIRHMTIAPRHPRVLHSGPRIRLFEALLVAVISVLFLAVFATWMMWRRDHHLLAAAAALGVILLVVRQLVLLVRFKRLKRLALSGLITRAHVTSSRRHRFSRALRADRALPWSGLPFVAGLEVSYAFIDEVDQEWTGSFLTATADESYYLPGTLHEIFYLPDGPELNTSSLAMRWYWRLGGPAMVDEAPEEDFPLDEDVIIEELM